MRQNLTLEKIHAAADEIAAKGETPTLEAVRQLVGGSFNTLGPALREWRQKQEVPAEAPGGKLPDSLREDLAGFGAKLWAEAAAGAERRTQAARDELDRTRQVMEEAKSELAEAADRLAGENEALKARCAEREEEIGSLRAELEAARQAAAEAQAHATAEKRVAEELREQLEATRKTLGGELASRIADLERARSTD